MPKYQATAYIRLSYTDDRSSESDSVTNQRKLIENFIERNPDIQIVSEKIDDGYSGIIFDRPAFKEMMQDITDGKINCVIVKDLSRLGREYIETGRYLRRVFPTYGVRFIAITDNIDTAHEGSGDDLTVSVKNIMNEAYCRDISIKTRTSLDIKRRNGDFVGAFPVYGYMKSEENKNLLVPDPYASRVVRDIFRMRLDGTSALRIATVLNEMGILSPLAYKKNNGFPYAKHGYADKEDCKWSATTIIRILQDETYIGTLVQGKQGTPHYKIKQMEQRPSSEWIRVPDAHEPLIAKQDFELVQRIRRLDTRTSPKQDTVYLFSGVLICGCCGSRMTRKTNRVKGKEYHYYYCPTGKKHGCANPVMLKESDLVECVKDSLKGYIDNVSCLQAIRGQPCVQFLLIVFLDVLWVLFQVLKRELFVLEIWDDAAFDGCAVGSIRCDFHAVLHHIQPFQQKIRKQNRGFIRAGIDLRHDVFFDPFQIDRILKSRNDDLMVHQQLICCRFVLLTLMAVETLQVSGRHL